jgi:hypothetical protein
MTGRADVPIRPDVVEAFYRLDTEHLRATDGRVWLDRFTGEPMSTELAKLAESALPHETAAVAVLAMAEADLAAKLADIAQQDHEDAVTFVEIVDGYDDIGDRT